MTPEQQRALEEFVAWSRTHREDARREDLVLKRLAELYTCVSNVGNNVAGIVEAQRKLEERVRRRLERHHDRISRIESPGREPLPSLGADDSGSIDISALGSSVKLRGAVPVRAAIGIVLAVLLLAGGWFAHTALAGAPSRDVGQAPAPRGTP